MSVADLSKETLQEVAKYLDDFPPRKRKDSDPEQYWYSLANAIRRRVVGGQFNLYNAHYLTNLDENGKGAQLLMKDLAKKKLDFDIFLSCLREVECQKALNCFTGATAPVIRNQPSQRQMKVRTGGTITLSVVADCHPGKPVYRWFKNQKNPLEGQTSSSLLIHKANTEDTGYYHCRVTNPYINDLQKGCVFTEYVHVDVTPPEVVNSNPTVRQEIGNRPYTPSPPLVITQHPSSVTSDSGKRVLLECKAKGAVCYDWYKNGQSYQQGMDNGVLILEACTVKDCGEYYCVVANDDGREQSKTAIVNVEEVPRDRNSDVIVFEEQPQAVVEVRVGKELKLTCRARSTTGEQVVYQWMQIQLGKKAKEVGSQSVFTRMTDNIIRKLSIELYCRVSLASDREVAAQSRRAKVTVITIWFTKQPQSIGKAFIGEKATLTCAAEGVGNIEYMWFKSTTKEGQFRHIKGATNTSGVLYFKHLKQEDWGYYQCQAFVDSDFIKSEIACVRPTIRPMKRTNSFKLPLIRMVKQPWPQVVKEKGKFRLLCKAVCTGDETLQYQWYHCASKIHGATEPEYIRDSANDSDCGPYYCEVRCSNNLGAMPVVSKTARIELAPEDEKQPQIVGRNGRQLDQLEAEKTLVTKKKERYAREKVALLIGNQHYDCEEMNDLRSPENDIRQLCSLLENELNFKVISLLDLTHSEMMHALERFYEMLAVSGVYALFYYSGHGFTTSVGKNYLIPVDASPSLSCDQNIHVDMICGQMRRKLSRAVVVLDCCRVKSRSHASLPTSLSDTSSLSSIESADPLTTANYVQITSCQDDNPAFDGQANELSPASTPSGQSRQLAYSQTKQPCSYFNVAFREALMERKRGLYDVFQYVLEKMCDIKQLTVASEQRPTYTGSFRDAKITLHDEVFLDNDENEPKLNKILTLYQQAHYVPETVVMESSEDLGELSGLTQLELSFSYHFSNVLCVHIKLYLLQGDKTSQANIEFDKTFLEGQGVTGVQTDCTYETPTTDTDVRGQGEPPQYFISTMIKISSIQRLKSDFLKLLLALSLQTEGKDRRTKVNYKFPKKPLFASLN